MSINTIESKSYNIEEIATHLFREAIETRGRVVAMMGGNSMEPNITDSMKITFEKTTDDIRLGDIIAYSANGITMVHRVVHIGRGVVYTKGDNRLEIEGPIKVGDILGKVVHIEEGGVKRRIGESTKKHPIALASYIAGMIYGIISDNMVISLEGRFTGLLRRLLNTPIRLLS
ncbi:MAG: hypothetical protein B6D57_00900 [Candidatus Coatesbacteria bacterium 4484_99]|uniref:Peptidase S24/S26A/S26B/S26C domain-containing protein n=1 Tax=Candidatus Coatesbacteria bacterium 4484_99 TaxID=1970774 RepID=A0A1W9S487_9BACT|nr:MAG: hypothetical protein B6D57_00900 [Candidatus Coatesbacteria bacterium 4484_99]RLC40727.1 MAG: hypothetical protein DRH49_06625 [Candidatus Coatesbacteria bacterium]RLC43439.1 MAG: hypothetical protein DRH44_04895 [Candidatus Coatesbacteria bacterium]HEC79686.1 S26 family signal peptidase [Bacillota bacterium]